MTEIKNIEENVLKRVAQLPLVSSFLQQASVFYLDVKSRYPLLKLVGGLAELGINNVSTVAFQQAALLLQNLEPEIEAMNSLALVGLEQLEKLFPVLHQPSEEVVAQLKDTLFSSLDVAQSRVNEELDRAADRRNQLVQLSWRLLTEAQESAPGRVITAGLDEIITQSEVAVAQYLPLSPSLRYEWETMLQSYEDEDEYEDEDDDDDAEPRMWTRIRSLLLCLYLQLFHRLKKLREKADSVLQVLGTAAETVGIHQLMEVVSSLLQLLLTFYTSQVLRVEGLRTLIIARLTSGVQALMIVTPVQQILAVPAQVQAFRMELLELGEILIQLLINTTPLYDLMKEVSDSDAAIKIPDELLESPPNRMDESNNLFLKAMDARPRRRSSLYTRSRRGSASATPASPTVSPSPATVPANGRKGSLKLDSPVSPDSLAVSNSDMNRRRSSTTEVLLAPIMQIVSQSQRAFEFFSSGPTSEDQDVPMEETTEP